LIKTRTNPRIIPVATNDGRSFVAALMIFNAEKNAERITKRT